MQNSQLDLTIVTVAGPADESYIRHNINAIKSKNPEHYSPIVVIDNGKFAEPLNGINSVLDATVIDGVSQDTELPPNYRGSYQHGNALNDFFKYQKITTRFVLIIDPDFYVVMDGWIKHLLAYMQQEDVAFFGAPWHPRWYSKYRYFPCVHFMCIDTSKIDLATLNFLPDLPLKEQPVKKTSLLLLPIKMLYFMTMHRKVVGGAKDTGYQIFQKFFLSEKCRLLQPVMSPQINFVQSKLLQFPLARICEGILPDHLCYVPKKQNYYTSKNFADAGLINMSSLGWEEFMWQGKPFGFHLRRFMKKERDIKMELEHIEKVFFPK